MSLPGPRSEATGARTREVPRAALVTGAAKRLGRAIALALADAGWDVAIHYHQSRDEAEATAAEVRARGAKTIVMAEADDEEARAAAAVFIELPKLSTLLQPVAALIPLQLVACELATVQGHDVDQPRNLAKSVTVE